MQKSKREILKELEKWFMYHIEAQESILPSDGPEYIDTNLDYYLDNFYELSFRKPMCAEENGDVFVSYDEAGEFFHNNMREIDDLIEYCYDEIYPKGKETLKEKIFNELEERFKNYIKLQESIRTGEKLYIQDIDVNYYLSYFYSKDYLRHYIYNESDYYSDYRDVEEFFDDNEYEIDDLIEDCYKEVVH